MNSKIGNNVILEATSKDSVYDILMMSVLLQTIKDLVCIYSGGVIISDTAESIENWLRFSYNIGIIKTNPEYIIQECKVLAKENNNE